MEKIGILAFGGAGWSYLRYLTLHYDAMSAFGKILLCVLFAVALIASVSSSWWMSALARRSARKHVGYIGRISMREAEEMLTVAMKPRKRGFWWWVLIFYGVMLWLGLIFGIIDEVILKKDGGAGEMPERENTGILPVDNVREPADAQTDASNETAIGIKTDGGKEVGKKEPKITDEKTETAGDNADYVAIYDKYMAEMNEVLEHDYEPGMDRDAAMSLMSSKSIEVADISSRMVDELTMAGCPYGEMSRLSDLLYENMKKTVERIYGLKY